jgi:hypothetical protein
MSFIEIWRHQVTLTVPGLVRLEGCATQAFTAGAKPWGFVVTIDGAQVWNGGSIDVQGVVNVPGVKACEPGVREVVVTWAADPTVQLMSFEGFLLGYNKSSG